MPMRRASAIPIETMVAPVSTRNCTIAPLMLPVVMKWPRASATRVTLLEAVKVERALESWLVPSVRLRRLPLISNSADSGVALISLMPLGALSPSRSTRGLRPPPTVTTALPLRQTDDIDLVLGACAAQPPGAGERSSRAASRIDLKLAPVSIVCSLSALRSMKPVAIFRHFVTEGPGYFATYLDRAGLPWKLIKLDEGEAVPPSADVVQRARVHGRAHERQRRPALDPAGAGPDPRGGRKRRAGARALPGRAADGQGAGRAGDARAGQGDRLGRGEGRGRDAEARHGSGRTARAS